MMRSKKVDEAKMALVSGKRVGPVSLTVMRNVQHEDPAVQCVGAAVAFLLICRRAGCHPGNAMAIANNLIEEMNVHHPELRATRDYIANEV